VLRFARRLEGIAEAAGAPTPHPVGDDQGIAGPDPEHPLEVVAVVVGQFR
jgi:hypothetical protein